MGYTRLSLETGAAEFFRPARKLYEKFGFGYSRAVRRPTGRPEQRVHDQGAQLKRGARPVASQVAG